MRAVLRADLLAMKNAIDTIQGGICAPMSGVRALELATATDGVPHPGGAVACGEARWERMEHEGAVVLVACTAGSDRAGVTVYAAGKYVSYRDCTRTEAIETIEGLRRAGFSSAEYRP